MWSKRLMRMVMAGMAVLVWSTSVAAQECQQPPAKIAALVDFDTRATSIYLFCDKERAPACAVTFWCGSSSVGAPVPHEDPITWDVSVEPGRMFRYWRRYYGANAPDPPLGTLYEALTNAGWPRHYATGGASMRTCVVRSNDPVEVIAFHDSRFGRRIV